MQMVPPASDRGRLYACYKNNTSIFGGRAGRWPHYLINYLTYGYMYCLRIEINMYIILQRVSDNALYANQQGNLYVNTIN